MWVIQWISVVVMKSIIQHRVGDIFPLTTHQFEDKEFPVPYNADALLRRLYGDYMQLPDLSKLNLHVSKLEFYDD